MALRYAEAKAVLDEVAVDLKARLDGLRAIQVRADREQQLAAGMSTKYSGVSTEINTIAAANPGDAQWQEIKAVKDKLAGEFAGVLALANAMKAAAEGVTVD